jgi:hypothetical protein
MSINVEKPKIIICVDGLAIGIDCADSHALSMSTARIVPTVSLGTCLC